MSITKAVLNRMLAFAGRTFTEIGGYTGNFIRRFTGFMCLAVVLGSVSRPVTATPLSGAVSTLDAEATGLSTKTGEAAGDVNTLIERYRMSNAGQCALLVAGLSSSNSVPIYFIPGPSPVAGLQADVIVGPGLTVTSIADGPAAQVAGKSIQAAPVPGGERFLLFGVNANSLGAGKIATVNFDTAGAPAGPHIIALVNFVAADASGTGVPLCVTTGVITK